MCKPIYTTLSLSTTAHILALNAAKKELEELIEYRDSTGCVKMHHGVKPATMGWCARFFYNLGQLRRKKLTCCRRLPSPENAEHVLDEMRLTHKKNKFTDHIPGSVRDALVGQMRAGKHGARMLARANRQQFEDSPEATDTGGASSSSGPAAAAVPNDAAGGIMGRADSDNSYGSDMEEEIDNRMRMINENARNEKLLYLQRARRGVADRVAAIRQAYRGHTNEVGDEEPIADAV